MGQFGKNSHKGLIVQGGLCGLIFDARGRPLRLPKNNSERFEILTNWRKSLGINLA
jgi:hypothetical protein